MRLSLLRAVMCALVLAASRAPARAQTSDSPRAPALSVEQRAANQRAAQAFLADHERSLQRARVEALREQNHRYVAPAVAAGVGVLALALGAGLFVRAWTDIGPEDDYNVPMDRAGLALMPLGAVSVLVATPMFALRLRRARVLARAEDELARSSAGARAPRVSLAGAGLRVSLSF